MNYRHSCVIDAELYYKDFVLVVLVQHDNVQKDDWTTQGYTLKEGERLIDALPPVMRLHAGSAGLVHPRWDEGAAAWAEGASAEEIAAWEADHPAPEIVRKPTAAEQLRADVDFLAAMTGVTL